MSECKENIMEMTMPQLFFSRAASDGERVLQMEKDSKGKFISYTYAQVAATWGLIGETSSAT